MRDAVNALLVERQSLERGFSGSLLLSGFGHAFLLAGLILVSLLPPPTPTLDGIFAFAAPLPRGGGGVPDAAPPAPAPARPDPPKAEPKPEPAAVEQSKILKPPTAAEPTRALPDPNTKKPKAAEKTPPPRSVVPPDAGVSRSGAGTSAQAPGLGLELTPGPGIPGGLASGGDFYLASVQQKIWMFWMQQVRAEQAQTVSVAFTILADGSVADVQITQPSGVALLDLAAKRAVLSSAPFRPLPKTYGTSITIQANFRPTP